MELLGYTCGIRKIDRVKNEVVPYLYDERLEKIVL